MQIPTLKKYIKSNQNKFAMKTNAFKGLAYLFIMLWCDKPVSTVLACYIKTLPVCGII